LTRNVTALGYVYITMDGFMKEAGCSINVTERDTRNSVTVTLTLVMTLTEGLTAKVSIPGLMERLMMGNGAKESNTAMEYGRVTMATPTWVSGTRIKLTVTVFTSGQMATSMRENGITAYAMELALIGSTVEICTEDNTHSVA
jgi:hypothetical protein